MSGPRKGAFWMTPLQAWIAAAMTTLAATAGAGCTTEAYCFSDCGSGGGSTSTSATTSSGIGGDISIGTGVGGDISVGTGAGGNPTTGCMPTNGGIETCDGVDNDCNGTVDEGFDLANPKTCGICTNNCYKSLTGCSPQTITCTPSAKPGQDPGTCNCGACAQDYFDLDKNGTCEYYCVKTADDDKSCNHNDDDCDGVKDEDVDLCSTLNCGKCNGSCVVFHGQPACVHTGTGACDASNTQCKIQSCDCNGPGDCWWNIDGSDATGCEYKCDPTNGGVEICDGLDNDCDGKIDGADDLMGDPRVGAACSGGTQGECAAASHAGVGQCAGGQIVCTGSAVLVPNQALEVCNGKDDDCDGAIDDSPTDAGGACGMSNIFPCSLGAKQCQNGVLVCVGAVDPGVETCNGVDDDCDGNIDMTGSAQPSDSVGACNVPTAPPPGATSPCKAGAKACQGGAIVCVGAVGPSAAADGCNDDANCDGTITGQPDLTTDVHNCGACGNDCVAGAVHASWACVPVNGVGTCTFQGCQNGYYDNGAFPDATAGDGKCGYACTFVSAQEACNNVDDNCNGKIDEGVTAPSPAQVCGVNPSATAPECTSMVGVACVGGNWQCTFPAGVCSPTCASTAETCDALDNNCNGLLNENVANYGKPCASDSGKPAPGDGACRTFGTYACNPAGTSTICSAVKADCANLPGGCTELCDGIDNDCDGMVDEAFNAKGSAPATFVKPVVTKISATRWVYSYEASRPTATNIVPGMGNGYYTSAPTGVTIDKTPACSVQGKIPWYNVTGTEVEQTCSSMGGFICTPADWQTACHATVPCKWGYAPRGAGTCSTGYLTNPPNNPGKYCNLANSYDFDSATAGDQDGLLVTGSPSLSKCSADWSGLLGNVAGRDQIFDITGNLREITKSATNQYNILGGAFDSQDESGSSCDFTFYTVDQNFKFYDAGFRCCFSSDPTL